MCAVPHSWYIFHTHWCSVHQNRNVQCYFDIKVCAQGTQWVLQFWEITLVWVMACQECNIETAITWHTPSQIYEDFFFLIIVCVGKCCSFKKEIKVWSQQDFFFFLRSWMGAYNTILWLFWKWQLGFDLYFRSAEEVHLCIYLCPVIIVEMSTFKTVVAVF